MGWFDDIKGAIFGRKDAAPKDTKAARLSSTPPAPPVMPAATPAPKPGASPTMTAESEPVAAAVEDAPPVVVDVAAVLDAAVSAKEQELDWRKSIVDLLKAIDVDSSLSARKEMAAELGYGGDTHDSAKMNVWLHKQVMQKLAANGGKVPPDLLD